MPCILIRSTCCLFLAATICSSIAWSGTAADPINDLLYMDPESTPDPDIISVGAHVRGSDLRVSVEFKPGTFKMPTTSPAVNRGTGVGIYFDTDLNPATGGTGVSLGGNDFSTIGWEVLIALEGPSSGLFHYVGPENDDVELKGNVISTFTDDGFTTIVPLNTLSSDLTMPHSGTLSAKVTSFQYIAQGGEIIGGTGIFDVAPDIGQSALGVFQGDYDDNGSVTVDDYHAWQETYGTTVPIPGSGADGNSDGVINAADYVIWRNNNGAAPPPGDPEASAAAVPEPAMSWLLAGIMPWIALRRGHRSCKQPRRRAVPACLSKST